MKKTLILHPILFAVYPSLLLYAANPGEFELRQLAGPIAVSLIFGAILWLGFGVFLKNWHKGALIASLSLFLFFTYGHLVRAIPDAWLQGATALWGLLLLLLTAGIIRTRRSLAAASLVANVIVGVMVGLCVFQIAAARLTPRQAVGTDGGDEIVGASRGSRPDIYFIVLDGYGRGDVLAAMYGLDNGPFLAALGERGFYVAEAARANYMQTIFSLASCLDIGYLDQLAREAGVESSNRQAVRRRLRDNRVLRFLRQEGYTLAAFASGLEDTELRHADLYLGDGRSVDDFHNELMNATPLPELRGLWGPSESFDEHRERILATFEQLGQAPRLGRSPMFVFAHLMTPHPPFVFGPKGEKRYPDLRFHLLDGNMLVRPRGLDMRQYRLQYRDQLAYVNRLVIGMVDEILSASGEPPIIVLFGDHGPRSTLVWRDPERTMQWEVMANFAAFYLPDDGARRLYPEITPVNFFRAILPHYFETELELLEDRSYFSTDNRPYAFLDVTERAVPPEP